LFCAASPVSTAATSTCDIGAAAGAPEEPPPTVADAASATLAGALKIAFMMLPKMLIVISRIVVAAA
jgi:hypothetical protein